MKLLQMTHLRVRIAVVAVVVSEVLKCLLLVGTELDVVVVVLYGLVHVTGYVSLEELDKSSRGP